jgi:hypothetical protein
MKSVNCLSCSVMFDPVFTYRICFTDYELGGYKDLCQRSW